MNAPKTMPKPLKSLCARVALERTRGAVWDAAKVLRVKSREMLDAGRSEVDVEAWLHGELAAAVASQSRISTLTHQGTT